MRGYSRSCTDAIPTGSPEPAHPPAQTAPRSPSVAVPSRVGSPFGQSTAILKVCSPADTGPVVD